MTDWTNPCQRAAALRDAYYRVLSGQHEIEIEVRAGEGGQVVKFGKADLARLKAEWQAAEDECQRANGVMPAPRRFAIGLGGSRWPNC